MSSILVPVSPLYGALYFSAVLSVGFYGMTCMQTFFYYVHYQEDRLSMKSLVAIVWVMDTLHQSLIISGVYKYIMIGLVNPASFLAVVQELVWELLISTLVSVPTQAFFVYRIYRFSENNIIIPLVWLPLGIFQFVAALLYTGKGVHTTSIVTLGDAFFTGISISYCSVAAGADILIATYMTYLLTRRRVANGLKNTARILQLLTVFAINSGVWTALFALLTIIFLHAFPNELIYVVFDFPLCSIYCNTLLANLNARSYIKNQSSVISVGADLKSDSPGSCTRYGAQNAELRFFPPSTQQTSTFMSSAEANHSTKVVPL